MSGSEDKEHNVERHLGIDEKEPETDEGLGIDPDHSENSTEFSMKLINSVQALNNGQIEHYEMVGSFKIEDELKCLFVFVKALPHNPIVPLYPEAPFLFFKGVPVPKSFDLSESDVLDVENFIKNQYGEKFKDIRLHDLDQYYLDAYETSIQIYNDMVEKTRNSYLAKVKQAKSQVIEVSAAMVCGLVILLALISLS